MDYKPSASVSRLAVAWTPAAPGRRRAPYSAARDPAHIDEPSAAAESPLDEEALARIDTIIAGAVTVVRALTRGHLKELHTGK